MRAWISSATSSIYVLPHAEIRWLWRVKRLAPAVFTRTIGRLERRGYFSRQ